MTHSIKFVCILKVTNIFTSDSPWLPFLPWPVGDIHLTSFPFTSECEKFHVTNGQPWPVGDSTNFQKSGTSFGKSDTSFGKSGTSFGKRSTSF